MSKLCIFKHSQAQQYVSAHHINLLTVIEKALQKHFMVICTLVRRILK